MAKFSDVISRQIQDEINRSGLIPGSIGELNEIAQKIMERHNNTPVKEFEGLSPHQMYMVMNKFFESGCPVLFKPGPYNRTLDRVPVMMAYSVICRHLNEGNGIKLTPKGSMPRKIVNDIYKLDLYADKEEKYLTSKGLNEIDFIPAAYTRALMKAAGYVTVRHNKLSLTKKGKSAKDPADLYRALFTAFTGRFHKGYLDGYGSESIGNLGIVYVLYLLKRYGREKKEASFYAERYFRAFPDIMSEIQPGPSRDTAKTAFDCFNYRIFTKGLFLFGLVEAEYEGDRYSDRRVFVKTTEVFHQVFEG